MRRAGAGSFARRMMLTVLVGAAFLFSGCRGPTRTSIALEKCSYDGTHITTCLLGEDYHRLEAIDWGHNGATETTRKWLSVYSRIPGEATSKKLIEIPLENQMWQTVVRCDHRGVLFEEGTSNRMTSRLRYWDFASKKCETLLTTTDYDQVISASNDDSLVLGMKDRIRLFNPTSQTSVDFERRDVGFFWSGDLSLNRLLIAGRLGGSLFAPRLIEYRDGQLVRTIHLKGSPLIFTAFYVDGQAGYLVVDGEDEDRFLGLFDAEGRLRSRIPLPKTPDTPDVGFTVTTAGGVRFFCAIPVALAERESELLMKTLVVRCDGWTLTKVE